MAKLANAKTARCAGRVPRRMPDVTIGFGSNGTPFLLQVILARSRAFSNITGQPFGAQLPEPGGFRYRPNNIKAVPLQRVGKRAGVIDHLLNIQFELRLERLGKGHRLAAITCMSGPP